METNPIVLSVTLQGRGWGRVSRTHYTSGFPHYTSHPSCHSVSSLSLRIVWKMGKKIVSSNTSCFLCKLVHTGIFKTLDGEVWSGWKFVMFWDSDGQCGTELRCELLDYHCPLEGQRTSDCCASQELSFLYDLSDWPLNSPVCMSSFLHRPTESTVDLSSPVCILRQHPNKSWLCVLFVKFVVFS